MRLIAAVSKVVKCVIHNLKLIYSVLLREQPETTGELYNIMHNKLAVFKEQK